VWDFEKDGRPLNVRVDGQLVVNGLNQVVNAALQGIGLAFTLEDLVREHIAAGTLVRVLEDWCPPFAGSLLSKPAPGIARVRAGRERAVPDRMMLRIWHESQAPALARS
jgi:DNA-binding transcriptional LysR family regulator